MGAALLFEMCDLQLCPRSAPAHPATGVSDPGCETLPLTYVSPAWEWALLCVCPQLWEPEQDKTTLGLLPPPGGGEVPIQQLMPGGQR